MPGWIEAVATAVAAVGVIYAGRTWRADREDRLRAQASLVAAWVSTRYGQTTRVIEVKNTSQLPISQAHAIAHRDGVALPLQTRSSLAPGEPSSFHFDENMFEAAGLPYDKTWRHGKEGLITFELTFTDYAGVGWHRAPNGKLTRTTR